MALEVAYTVITAGQSPAGLPGVVLMPSSLAGKVLVFEGGKQVSIIPGGGKVLDDIPPSGPNDGNWQQAVLDGVVLKFQPGGDNDPTAPTYLLVP